MASLYTQVYHLFNINAKAFDIYYALKNASITNTGDILVICRDKKRARKYFENMTQKFSIKGDSRKLEIYIEDTKCKFKGIEELEEIHDGIRIKKVIFKEDI